MKHYITIATALLLSAVLIFNPAAKAVAVTPGFGADPSSGTLNLVSSYTVDYELDSTDNPYPVGNYCVATYEGYLNCFVNQIGADSYYNGYVLGTVQVNATSPSGWTLSASNISFEANNGSSYFVSAYNNSTGGTSYQTIYVRTYFDNFFTVTGGILGVGRIKVSFTYTYQVTPNNLPDVPDRVYFTRSVNSGSSCYGTTEPSSEGLTGIITQAILNAVNDQSMPFIDILQVLEDIRTQDQTNYTTIVAYLADNDTFNSTLYTWLTTVLEDNFTDLLDDTTYISSLLNAARNLINAMNNRDSLYYPIFEAALDLANTRLQTLINLMSETPAEAASMENAINQMESKQAAINDYSLPAAGNIMGNANSYVNQGSAGMNLLATILNQPLYILILMTVISLAFVSYLLYGKGV